ncbi:MAG TPA: hypothetical protein VLF59_00130 [Candidatus Saccharimonadales bacterium]|nr:hypothetical protein [Candidatus Saccharimonadales bacterium]
MPERYPVEFEHSIRAQADVFSYSALRRWFSAIPRRAHQTPTSAFIPDSAYHVRVQGGWVRKNLTAIFTPMDDPLAPVVSVRARTHSDNETRDYDLLGDPDQPLFWQRDAGSTLALHAPDAPYDRTLASKPGPYIIRVENDTYLTQPVAEAATLTVGALLRSQMDRVSSLPTPEDSAA